MKRQLHEKLDFNSIGLKYILNHKKIRFHWHEEMEILYFEYGKADLYVDGRRYEAEAGDLIVINPLETHYGIFLSETAKHHVLHVSTDLLDFSKNSPRLIAGRVKDSECVRLFEELVRIHRDKSDGYIYALKSTLFALLHRLVTRYPAPFTGYQRSSGDDNKKRLLNSVLEYINKNLEEDISLELLCKRFFVSSSYLSHLFKDVVGVGVIEYVNKTRVEKAKLLLLNPELSITEVSDMCGFSDLNYFSRRFKLQEGMTPTEYRAKDR